MKRLGNHSLNGHLHQERRRRLLSLIAATVLEGDDHVAVLASSGSRAASAGPWGRSAAPSCPRIGPPRYPCIEQCPIFQPGPAQASAAPAPWCSHHDVVVCGTWTVCAGHSFGGRSAALGGGPGWRGRRRPRRCSAHGTAAGGVAVGSPRRRAGTPSPTRTKVEMSPRSGDRWPHMATRNKGRVEADSPRLFARTRPAGPHASRSGHDAQDLGAHRDEARTRSPAEAWACGAHAESANRRTGGVLYARSERLRGCGPCADTSWPAPSCGPPVPARGRCR